MTEKKHRLTAELMKSAAHVSNQEQPLRLLTLPEVIHRIGLKKSWLFEAIAAGEFPSPVKSIPARRLLFSSHAIEQWLAEKTATAAAPGLSAKSQIK